MIEMKIGQKVPSFTVSIEAGKTVSLEDYEGKKLLLFFYPKDDTPGCTLESCAFRDAYEKLQNQGVDILGVSVDSLESHARFKQKYALPYDLGSDEQGKICRQYGVLKDPQGAIAASNIRRSTFLIDEKGLLLQEWRDVSVNGHMGDIWKQLAT